MSLGGCLHGLSSQQNGGTRERAFGNIHKIYCRHQRLNKRRVVWTYLDKFIDLATDSLDSLGISVDGVIVADIIDD